MRRLILTLAIFGCAGGGNFDKLSQADKDVFMRCLTPTQTVRCGTDTDLLYVSICNRGSQATYADVPTERGRREWLVGNGCPPTMVQPERFVAGDNSPAARYPVPMQAASAPPPPAVQATAQPPSATPQSVGHGGGTWVDPFK